ncbi:hypothetical protein FJR38_27320 [Anabaena sp. UHCC 0253]|uniref:plasmid replication protein, CyRepA1 family n=1 Tax=Anabaena sp. UHCC 0253 TaxID=2590019 RepID=UPI0014458453|nr:plasmid replication protein, CyRepA1 family [Anabaena sp. UHCC 0253]MTJ56091.1 hypothetical protein [Anabaena sp. UHCC 0253]
MSKGYYQLIPCPVCASDSGKCRGKEDSGKEFIQCMTLADAVKGHIENGYKCIKPSNNGFQHNSATFVLDNSQEWTEQQLEEWKTRQALRKADERLEEQAKRENALSVDDRHRHYTKILKSLSLDAATIADLKNRGFSQDEIANCGFKSLSNLYPYTFKSKDGENVTIYYKNLSFNVDPRLPGVNKKGSSLQVSGEGYLCPLRDYQGRIVALQLRLHKAENTGRYRWLSSSGTLALDVNGSLENPLTVFKPENPTGIAIVEGTGAKPYLASRRLNNIVIGAAGGQFAGSPKLLEEYLRRASEDVGSKEVVIYPDAGDVKNSSVMTRWEQVANLIMSFGYTVKFAWWGQVDKECCDIDELDNFDNISYPLLGDIKAIASEFQSKEVDDWAWDMWKKSHRFSATSKQNDPLFKFPDIPESNAIIASKAPMGGGKTEASLKLIKKAKKGVRIVGYRNNLLHQTIERARENGIIIYHLNDDFGNDDKILIQDENTHLAFCINSAHNEGINYEGHDVYIDESVSVLLHIIDGGTFSNFEQRRAMEQLEIIVKAANRVFLLDGNQTDLVVDFIAKLDPSKKVIKIENTRKPKPHNIIFCDGILKLEDGEIELKPRAKSHLIKRMKDNKCTPFVATDSKKLAHELARLLTKEGKKGIVISADTIAEAHIKEFLKNPDKWIAENKPQFVIITPSCESGISIKYNGESQIINDVEVTIPYFTHKFSFFCGVLGTSSQMQIMFRLRDNTPDHYVFCPHSTQLRDNSIPTNYTPRAIISTILDRINLNKTMAIDLANDKESAKDIIAHLISSQKDDKWFDIGAKFWGLANYEKQNLRKCLMYKLEESGHNVTEIQEEIDHQLDDQLKEMKIELIEAEAKLMYNLEPFATLEEAKKLEKKDNNLITNQKIKKTKMILERLPGIHEVEGYSVKFWENHLQDRSWVTGHENYARLVNFDVAMKQHEADYHFKSTADYCFLAGMRSLRTSRLWALNELKFLDLIQYDEDYCRFSEFSKFSPEIISIIEQINAREDLRIALGMSEPIKPQKNDKHIMETFKTLLGYVGLGFGEPVQKINPNTNKKCRYYRLEPSEFNDPLRLAIIDIVIQKDTQWLQSDKAKVDWTLNKSADQLSIELVTTYADDSCLGFFEKSVAPQYEPTEEYKQAKEKSDKYSKAIQLAEDILSDALANNYRVVKSASEFISVRGNTLTYRSNLACESASMKNNSVSRIIDHAWDKLSQDDKDRIYDFAVMPQIADLDKAILENNTRLSPVHFEALNQQDTWRLRLEQAAFNYGKNFAKFVYSQVDANLRNSIWSKLSYDCQMRYIEVCK